MAKKKVAVDLGHYKCDSGAVYKWNGKSIREVDLAEDMGRACGKALERSGIEVLLTYGSLTNRTNMANEWKADIFVSIHTNAGNGDGVEVFYSPNSKDKGNFARKVLENILEDKLNNSRGVKTANFSVLRNSNMTACLVEAAFGDNSNDYKAIDELSERIAFGEAIAEGVCEYLGIKYLAQNDKPQPSNDEIFRIRKSWSDASSQKGAYKDKNGAIAECKKHSGYKVFDKNGKEIYSNGGQSVAPPPPKPPVQPSKPQGKENIKKVQRLCNKVLGTKLDVDGLWGSKTESAVKKLPLCGYPYTQRECTKFVQEVLKLSVDGIFGRGSEKKVKEFQKSKGLGADGIVGFQTYKALANK